MILTVFDLSFFETGFTKDNKIQYSYRKYNCADHAMNIYEIYEQYS